MKQFLVNMLLADVFKGILGGATNKGFKVQSLTFEKKFFDNKKLISDWAKRNGFDSSSIEESDDAFVIKQLGKEGFQQIRTIHIAEGVKVDGGPILAGDGKSTIILEVNKPAYMLCNFSIKKAPARTKLLSPDDEVIIQGIANENAEDRMEEIVDPAGAELTNFFNNPMLLYQHNHGEPIGGVTRMEAHEDGMHFEAWVGKPKKGPLTDTQVKVRTLVAQGVLQTVSIGFIPLEIEYPTFDNEGRLLKPMVIKRWELLELSIVAVPANAGSLFDVKSFTEQLQIFSNLAKTVIVKSTTKTPIGLTEAEMEKLEELLKELIGISKSIAADQKTALENQKLFQTALDKIDAAKETPPADDDAEKKLDALADAVTLLGANVSDFIKKQTEDAAA